MNALEQWLADRPEIVKMMARRYPPGTSFRIHGKVVWIVSFREDGSVMVSETNPGDNYDKAVATRGRLDEVRIA